MTISEFYEYVRTRTGANERDLSNDDIAILANPEADYLYELSIQASHLQQTKNQNPTVLTYIMNTNFQPTDHNLWIERVEASVDNGQSYTTLKRTNNAEYNLHKEECGESLTDELAKRNDKPEYFVQSSQGITIFPMSSEVITKLYIKDTPVINWGDTNSEILLPNVPTLLLALKTAMMYRDIDDIGRLTSIQNDYDEKFKAFTKRLAKGGRVIQMAQKNNTII